ncbi:MAG: hypothetical protein RLY43_2145 [Bacteroidota bacterium]|jgi:hypothetical protein
MDLKIIDFTELSNRGQSICGLIVRRSNFWLEQHCQKKSSQIGIITGLKFFEDEKKTMYWLAYHTLGK